MFFKFKQILIYSSKNKEEWLKAQELLSKAEISFKTYITEEPPLVCCGARLDPREFWTGKKRAREIYQILVNKEFKSKAEILLKDL